MFRWEWGQLFKQNGHNKCWNWMWTTFNPFSILSRRMDRFWGKIHRYVIISKKGKSRVLCTILYSYTCPVGLIYIGIHKKIHNSSAKNLPLPLLETTWTWQNWIQQLKKKQRNDISHETTLMASLPKLIVKCGVAFNKFPLFTEGKKNTLFVMDGSPNHYWCQALPNMNLIWCYKDVTSTRPATYTKCNFLTVRTSPDVDCAPVQILNISSSETSVWRHMASRTYLPTAGPVFR